MRAESEQKTKHDENIVFSFSGKDVQVIGAVVDWLASHHEAEFDSFEEELRLVDVNISGPQILPGLVRKFNDTNPYGFEDAIYDIPLSPDEVEYLGAKLAHAREFNIDVEPEFATVNFQYRFKTGRGIDLYRDLIEDLTRLDGSDAA